MQKNTLLRPSHSVLFGETEIRFSLNFVDRKTLAIHVYPDGGVNVDAPLSAELEKIYDKVKKRSLWILKQQRQFAAYPPALPARRYVSGETHRYLGRQYRLKIMAGDSETVKLTRGSLQVETQHPQGSLRVQRLLQTWYRSKALTVFTERYAQCVQYVERLGIYHNKGFQLRFMSKRWGSCTGKGTIILNPELIAAPKDCIDYVIIHELCHLKEHNHGQAFYRLLNAVLEDWEFRRKRLNEMVEVRFV
ncbi:M48 family metallopeptidase [Methylobacter sp. YRD-M1]|uniref:M48 family metallopeptidase n=1 Tax=Methylobacter sp. YRD-M1 TaxID=2911520 RepID=UPI00227C306E|nr:SprT family zinc-dependent metalloprotease [Methylobacter sp. YRD-M1]WAK04523.1 M48 family metallopeptidase [Methylobacter sp. YRD-M1]